MAKKEKPCCEVCGKAFVLTVYWKKYCSAKCRLVAWAKRQDKSTHA